ncbi:hypothetical protein E2542_SST27443 [Spatholobus suberectus]|nr:hypothetical protein E2542_SST27443 [Spatholobus suberectus]
MSRAHNAATFTRWFSRMPAAPPPTTGGSVACPQRCHLHAVALSHVCSAATSNPYLLRHARYQQRPVVARFLLGPYCVGRTKGLYWVKLLEQTSADFLERTDTMNGV